MIRSSLNRRKPGPTARSRASRKRKDDAYALKIRAKCVERDGMCRYWMDTYERCFVAIECSGPSEWAHMRGSTRAETRGMAPENRHSTTTSLMLCREHHNFYDGRRRPRLKIRPVTDRGADGPLEYS